MIKARYVIAAFLCLTGAAFADDGAKPHETLKGHPHLLKAEKDLHASAKAITKSQEANECVFRDEGGHGKKAKEAIAEAEKQVWEAAEWVNSHEKDCADLKAKGGKKEKQEAPTLKGHPDLKGHPHMIKAEKDLIEAFNAVVKSQEANECVFGVEGGHGQKAKEAIDAAFKQVTEAADWVSSHEDACKEKGKDKEKGKEKGKDK
jgi:hypothetical protein